MTRYGKKKKRKVQGGGGPLQQSFGESDTSIGALDVANKQQKAAGEESLRIRNEENQTGGFAKDFIPHPSMDGGQAQTQKGISDTMQQTQASSEFDNLVPKANNCLRNQAGAFGGGRRRSIFSRNNKKRRTKYRFKKKRTKKRRKKRKRGYGGRSPKRTKRRGGGKSTKKRRKRSKPKYRFSQRAPLKV